MGSTFDKALGFVFIGIGMLNLVTGLLAGSLAEEAMGVAIGAVGLHFLHRGFDH